ncbi:hypothetical protein [Mesorhizobium sophorae]|uniref:hypothetical protein n=1 Tax=Mesorhizobium sophorae TaxID=1300294 RepID=UPI000BA31A1F|nr:hypothetical protein [Mesorhizobium sophorae]
MDMLFCAHWKKKAGRGGGGQEADWMHQPAPAFGRFLAAVAIIGVAVCILDHAAAGKGRADTLVASTQQGSSK